MARDHRTLERRGLALLQTYAIVLAVFFASGFSALVYQVVWVEMLDKVFGVTTFAASAVLGAYFGGLALGGHLGGKLVARRNGLRLYGAIELALGTTAAAVPSVLAGLTDVYRALYPQMAGHEALLVLVRFLLSFLVLAAPTTLIGMALPVLVGALARGSDEIGERLPRLYGWNTFGSVLGALLTGYVLIGLLGLTRTLHVAVVVNIVAGAVALWAARVLPAPASAPGAIRAEPAVPETADDSAWRTVALAVTFCSGFAALGYEVAWFRALGLMSDHYAHTFSAIVAIVLVGIGAGSLMMARRGRRGSDPSLALTAVLLGLGLFGFLWLPLIAGLSSALGAVSEWFVPSPSRSAVPFAVAILVTLLPCLLMGMSFPLAVQVYARPSRGVGESVGRMYASNLIGAALGSVVAGFLLLPALGVQLTLLVLSFACLFAAALLHRRSSRSTHLVEIAAVAALAVGAAVFAPRDLFESLFVRVYPHARVLQSHEDIEATVTLAQHDASRIMYVNGAHQADDSPWTIGVHRLIGLVPCLVHGSVGQALVIGMGGGTTAGQVARCTDDTTIIEISPGVVQAARAFGTHNGHIADSRTAKTVIADGRNYLLVTDRRFDLMTADTIRPIFAQSGNLYSRDYYRLMATRLNERGLVFQWVDVSLRDHEQRILMRTFVSAFPHVAMSELGGNKFLVGSNEPLSLDPATLGPRLTPDVLRELANAGVASAETFLSSFALTGAALRAEIGDGPIISDDRPINEYFSLLRRGGLWKWLPVESAAYR